MAPVPRIVATPFRIWSMSVVPRRAERRCRRDDLSEHVGIQSGEDLEPAFVVEELLEQVDRFEDGVGDVVDRHRELGEGFGHECQGDVELGLVGRGIQVALRRCPSGSAPICLKSCTAEAFSGVNVCKLGNSQRESWPNGTMTGSRRFQSTTPGKCARLWCLRGRRRRGR